MTDGHFFTLIGLLTIRVLQFKFVKLDKLSKHTTWGNLKWLTPRGVNLHDSMQHEPVQKLFV